MHATQTPAATTDEQQIRRLYDGLLAAWTRGDAQAYGAGFTADVDYVPFDGSRLSGRQAVVDSHDRLFRGVLTGSALVGGVETVRHIDADVAVVHAFGSVLMPWRSKLP
ncbi:MAG TPA: SgcJ/EcaC family oxidoreductase, partial [Euzebyales bacterium]|nr:SgcJ/EcaC family oxidoreductase [Euzebyales bacterium]